MAAAAYNGELRELRVEFRDGSRYAYYDVDEEVYDTLVTSYSPGSYMASVVKPVYGQDAERIA